MAEAVVPFADLYAQYLTIRSEVDAAIAAVIKSSGFIRGSYVQTFEEQFARAVELPHCVSCANGTDSLYIAMRALGVGPGDEVIVPAHSWISTSAMVTHAGCKVVFCDTDGQTFTISPEDIERKITPRTVGIIPVHLYGQPADMDAIMAIAARHRLWVIEDCAQAHLARYKGRLVGTFGAAASYSFYPGKNLGAMGDAGAVLTSDARLAERMAIIARHGGLTKGEHLTEGINSRLDGLQAAVLSVKLPYLAQWTSRRREVAAEYDRLLAGIPGLATPVVAAGREHVYHLYVVRTRERDRLAACLGSQGIQSAIHYPVALPFLAAYSRYAHTPAQFPDAYGNQSMVLSLPMFPEISASQIEQVATAVRSCLS